MCVVDSTVTSSLSSLTHSLLATEERLSSTHTRKLAARTPMGSRGISHKRTHTRALCQAYSQQISKHSIFGHCFSCALGIATSREPPTMIIFRCRFFCSLRWKLSSREWCETEMEKTHFTAVATAACEIRNFDFIPKRTSSLRLPSPSFFVHPNTS